MNERQKEELLELRRMAEKEMRASGSEGDDVYMREYLENLDELLRLASLPTTAS